MIVKGNAGFKKSQNFIRIPYFRADSITIKFAIAPIMVALPAMVDADANANQSAEEPAIFKKGNIKMVKGTLLTTCEPKRLIT